MVVLVVGDDYGAAGLGLVGGEDELVDVMAVHAGTAVLGQQAGVDVEDAAAVALREEVTSQEAGAEDDRPGRTTSVMAAPKASSLSKSLRSMTSVGMRALRARSTPRTGGEAA